MLNFAQANSLQRYGITRDAFGLMVTSAFRRVNRLAWGNPASNLRAPAVNNFPPHQPEPLIEVDFGPLPMLPPGIPELRRIGRRGDRDVVAPQFVLKDAERAPGVIVRRHQQNALGSCSAEKTRNVLRLSFSGETKNQTNGNGLSIGQTADVSLGDGERLLIVDLGSCRYIQLQFRRIACT